ncbi:hypothetical protein SERLA73DRAFT_166928 [Serpula lacrymans var. lacrymans S7.3]|uniref:DUF6533 domain-containing protein n=1 Tax=Serpula lacrymans var. lacrymans (strain S7.3) TaxID=936435 RepID=F8PRY4_SERL3|nr:hypothetical protein SERLA73DRAFT_166928 [Serpula lacrymans var. lacrymans S7.3]
MSLLSASFRSGLQTSQVFDYCITLQTEVFWVWGKKWDLTRIMFAISRYLTFVCVVLITYRLLVMRTYAFWKGSKKFLIVVVLFGILMIAVGSVISSEVNCA